MSRRSRVEVRGGPSRCPFCHEACSTAEPNVACHACLARHHTACWDEGGRCAACGADERMEPATRRPAGREGGRPGRVSGGGPRLGPASPPALPPFPERRGWTLVGGFVGAAVLGSVLGGPAVLLVPLVLLPAAGLTAGATSRRLRWVLTAVAAVTAPSALIVATSAGPPSDWPYAFVFGALGGLLLGAFAWALGLPTRPRREG